MTRSADRGFAATVYVPPEEFSAPTVEVEGAAYRHLFRARRLAVGETLQAVNGLGDARRASVASVARRTARLELGEAVASPPPSRRVALVAASPRPERASWLVEKASELGVEAVRWLRSERAPRKLGKATLDRHRRIALAAMQQSGGARLPEISGPHRWEELDSLLGSFDAVCALDPDGERGAPREGAASMAVLVGPEGGWSAEERRRLADLGWLPGWSLGPRVLRIETAAVVAAGLLLNPPRPSGEVHSLAGEPGSC